MDLGLNGKIAMITGGSNGLGKQITYALAREGCHVSICARGKQRLDATEAELKALGVKILTSVADVTFQKKTTRSSKSLLPAVSKFTEFNEHFFGRRCFGHTRECFSKPSNNG